jgi:hypothetical protein
MPQNVPSECLRKRGKSSIVPLSDLAMFPTYSAHFRILMILPSVNRLTFISSPIGQDSRSSDWTSIAHGRPNPIAI